MLLAIKYLLFCLLGARIQRYLRYPDPLIEIRFHTKNHFIFNHVLKAQQTRKTVPKASNNNKKSTPKSIQHDFCEKLILAIPSLRKPWIWNPKHRWPGNKPETTIETSSLGTQQTFKIKPRNHSKINKNPVPDHLVSILLLPWSSSVVPRRQNGPQGAPQVPKWSPRVPKWSHRAA